jgi:hypothetical protein
MKIMIDHFVLRKTTAVVCCIIIMILKQMSLRAMWEGRERGETRKCCEYTVLFRRREEKHEPVRLEYDSSYHSLLKCLGATTTSHNGEKQNEWWDFHDDGGFNWLCTPRNIMTYDSLDIIATCNMTWLLQLWWVWHRYSALPESHLHHVSRSRPLVIGIQTTYLVLSIAPELVLSPLTFKTPIFKVKGVAALRSNQ